MTEKKIDEIDPLSEPPNTKTPAAHALWAPIKAGLREVYDPEIPVNIYELGLLYDIQITDDTAANVSDVKVIMTLTSPACPVAQEMPEMVKNAILPVDGVGEVTVEIVWDPTWDPSHMAETAKLQLNMFY